MARGEPFRNALLFKDLELGATPIDQARLVASELGERPREVFRHLVDAFLTSGEPVGSRTLSQRLPVSLSPASIRNVMADLEAMGLLYCAAYQRGPRADREGLAPLRRRPSRSRRTGARRTRHHRSAHDGGRPRRRRRADPGDHDAVGPVALRRSDRGDQAGSRAQAHRVRRRGARQDAGHHRGRRRPGGKPADRYAAGPAAVRADGSVELSELRGCAAARSKPRAPKSWPTSKANARCSTR